MLAVRDRPGGLSGKIAEYLLAQTSGSTLTEWESKGNYTPLILAVHLENEDIVRTLIDNTKFKTKTLNWTNDKEIIISDTEHYVPRSTALHFVRKY